jgi:hypothetical protein
MPPPANGGGHAPPLNSFAGGRTSPSASGVALSHLYIPLALEVAYGLSLAPGWLRAASIFLWRWVAGHPSSFF